MGENEKEKSLIKVSKKDNIFSKIFYFIKSFFKKQNKDTDIITRESVSESRDDTKEETFESYIKNIETKENKLLKLQKLYRNGEIKEENLTAIQIKDLCDLYDRQIESLKRSNEYRKQRLLINKQNFIQKNVTK